MKKPKAKEQNEDYTALASSADTQSEIANGAKANSRTSHYALAQFHMNAVQAHSQALACAPEDKVSAHESKIDAHEAKIQENLRAAEKAAKTVKAKNGKMTGKPSLSTLQQLVTQAIKDDERWDTDSHGYPEDSPNDWEPYCIDILTPDDDGSMTAVIRTDDGRTCKHGFSFDGESVTMDEGDSTPTTGYYVYTRKPKPENVIRCRDIGIPILTAKKTWKCGEPVDFQWMPGGIHTITASYGRGDNTKPIVLTVRCDEKTAERIQKRFAAIKADNPRRPPFGCVEHRAQERAFEPIEFKWSTDPEPGVYCTAEPSDLGARNVNGRIHTSFSPSFDTDAEYDKLEDLDGDGVWTFPDGVRGSESNPADVTTVDIQSVGSLTNWNAFKEILPIAARQAEPQPGTQQQHAETKVKMKVKLIKARGNQAAGTVVELADAEAVSAIASGEAITESEANAIAAREAREAELTTMKAERKTQQQETIKAAIVRAKERGAIPPKDETVQTKSLERLDKGADVELVVELINGMQSKDQTVLARRLTQPYREDGSGPVKVEVVNASLQELGASYIQAREPITDCVRKGQMKEAMELSRESSVRLKQMLARGEDFMLRDVIRAADYTDPNSQVGTLATGLVLMRNLGFLKNRLNWLPYFTTDLRNEPATFGQPIFTRYLAPPAVATFVPGIGFTTDATTISNASAGTVQTGVTTQTSGTRTLSVPSAVDRTVTLDQFKGVPIGFPVTTLAATVRNLFAEQRGAQLYSLAEAINNFVLGKIFAATWSGVVTSYGITNLDLKGFLSLKNRMELSKIPDIGRYALMHSYFYDGLQADGNLLTSKAILALINRDQSSFEDADMPPIFGVKPLGSQLALGTSGSSTLGTATVSSDGTAVTFGTNNAAGFAGNMSSMLFVARIPQDFTKTANELGIPASYAVEIVTEPDSGLSVMIFKNVNVSAWAIEVTVCLMYGAAQGDPRIGIILHP